MHALEGYTRLSPYDCRLGYARNCVTSLQGGRYTSLQVADLQRRSQGLE